MFIHIIPKIRLRFRGRKIELGRRSRLARYLLHECTLCALLVRLSIQRVFNVYVGWKCSSVFRAKFFTALSAHGLISQSHHYISIVYVLFQLTCGDGTAQIRTLLLITLIIVITAGGGDGKGLWSDTNIPTINSGLILIYVLFFLSSCYSTVILNDIVRIQLWVKVLGTSGCGDGIFCH